MSVAVVAGIAAAVVAGTCAAVLALVYRRIVRAGAGATPRAADAIVVFGAAVRADGPSLAVRVRVARAAALHREGWAPVIVCTGGVDEGRSEAKVMVSLLRDLGVPPEALVADDGGSSTREAIRTVALLGRGRWHRVLAVSSPYHLCRIDREARRRGWDATPVAARRDRAATRSERAHDRRMRLREAFAVLGYEVLAVVDRLASTRIGRALRRVARHLAARIAFLVRDADAVAQAGEALGRIIKDGVAGFRDTGAVATPASGLSPPLAGRRVSRFGIRHRRLHAGVDIAAPYGAPVRAAASGQVLRAGWLGPYGNVVVIHHGGGLATVYAHLAAVLVEDDDRISQGDVVGNVGETGRSFGAHLHFEVRVHGSPVDPEAFLVTA